ncbi:uncharacterized protein N7525_002313 [Penicillium rubens]|jgi:hypothetical protein|nr:uncharacterized protein N7525_002313 [Penicillium rubens]KAJ5278430.1 hypothetical protein N7524_004583 [Penicillium chrysogenum]KAJ5844572.1 hypothetical protein N7525_002313 [Penicillium rubens]
MTALEIDQYEGYICGAAMPTIDWATRRESTILRGPGDPGLVTSTENYMQSYKCTGNPRISPANATWFMTNFAWAMPLVNAVIKVLELSTAVTTNDIS